MNSTTVYYDMMFTAYEPSTLLSTISNPMLSMARLNYMVLNLNLTNTYQLTKALIKPQVPTPPAPRWCWWVNKSSWQTPIIKIPIAWVYDNVPSYLIYYLAMVMVTHLLLPSRLSIVVLREVISIIRSFSASTLLG
ncbi:hypothetical protein [Vulcanisaeta sp. JCM 16161]|uniref:hypothetical protein n=1 Tax=Vulcanisaeta sp. JCM 16161 TaxID=1295372 RepID=UPI001FB494EF|nr:hypothetical protein [Vulcanisaeta sp. JCM 16161]